MPTPLSSFAESRKDFSAKNKDVWRQWVVLPDPSRRYNYSMYRIVDKERVICRCYTLQIRLTRAGANPYRSRTISMKGHFNRS